MVTSDFICPVHTLHVHGGDSADIRASVRVWDLASRTITKTIVVGDPAHPAGTMEVQLIARDQRLRAFTAGMVDAREFAKLNRHITRGRIRVPIAASCPLGRAAQAQRRLEHDRVLGRMVLQLHRTNT